MQTFSLVGKPPDMGNRQFETLLYLTAGLSNREIGQRMGISPLTVNVYVDYLLRRYDFHTRAALVVHTWGRGVTRKNFRSYRRLDRFPRIDRFQDFYLLTGMVCDYTLPEIAELSGSLLFTTGSNQYRIGVLISRYGAISRADLLIKLLRAGQLPPQSRRPENLTRYVLGEFKSAQADGLLAAQIKDEVPGASAPPVK
jgi:DNA-binding CsgD family transcriptional regulator